MEQCAYNYSYETYMQAFFTRRPLRWFILLCALSQRASIKFHCKKTICPEVEKSRSFLTDVNASYNCLWFTAETSLLSNHEHFFLTGDLISINLLVFLRPYNKTCIQNVMQYMTLCDSEHNRKTLDFTENCKHAPVKTLSTVFNDICRLLQNLWEIQMELREVGSRFGLLGVGISFWASLYLDVEGMNHQHFSKFICQCLWQFFYNNTHSARYTKIWWACMCIQV